MTLTVFFGREIGNMLRYVGPALPAGDEMGAGGAILGLLVHFALMAIMTAVYVLAARRMPASLERPIQWGVLYGLATYAVMNWLVVPMRFDAPLPPSPLSMATQLFAHIVLVGIPDRPDRGAIPEASARVTDAGYSGTPLGKKLRLIARECECSSRECLSRSATPSREHRRHGPTGKLTFRDRAFEAAHIFVTARAALEAKIQTLLPLLETKRRHMGKLAEKGGEGRHRHYRRYDPRGRAVPMGLVDVKVCAVDATWSGLKLMIRKEL